MEPTERRIPRGFAFVAVALLGLAAAFTPWAERLDHVLLDSLWSNLRKFDARPAPGDIVIVGVDERTAASVNAPAGMWHEAIGMALVRLASARPRAIAIDLPLPERSFEDVRPGLDRALMVGLAAARENGPLVAALSVDVRTRGVRVIHAPYLALLGEERLGIGLLARDIDGVTRRFSLAVPTEDGAFPTLTGRLCRALARDCREGLLHFALGEPFGYVPLQRLLEMRDTGQLERLFRNRIVLLGETSRFSGRIGVPLNLAGWEEPAAETPAIVVQALALRTALLGAAPREASKPLIVIVVTLAALLVLMRNPGHAAVVAVLVLAAIYVLAALLLRGGIQLPASGPALTVLFALGWVAARAFLAAFELRRRA